MLLTKEEYQGSPAASSTSPPSSQTGVVDLSQSMDLSPMWGVWEKMTGLDLTPLSPLKWFNLKIPRISLNLDFFKGFDNPEKWARTKLKEIKTRFQKVQQKMEDYVDAKANVLKTRIQARLQHGISTTKQFAKKTTIYLAKNHWDVILASSIAFFLPFKIYRKIPLI